jgi:hypothetical protein
LAKGMDVSSIEVAFGTWRAAQLTRRRREPRRLWRVRPRQVHRDVRRDAR